MVSPKNDYLEESRTDCLFLSPEQKEKAKADKAAKFAAKQKLKQQQAPAAQAPPKAKAKAPAAALPVYKDETPLGEKKIIQDFEHPHFSAYNPSAVESAWYQWWEKSGFFKPETHGSSDVGTYVIPLPPPNVTGALHCGHALVSAWWFSNPQGR